MQIYLNLGEISNPRKEVLFGRSNLIRKLISPIVIKMFESFFLMNFY